MKSSIQLLGILLLSILLTTSCTKKEKEPKTDYKLLAADLSLVQNASDEVFRKTDHESKNGTYRDSIGSGKDGIFVYRSATDTCAIITLNTNGGVFPMTLTIDFGTGCTDAYGITRKGKITANYSGMYQDSGTVVTVTTDNYFVNNHKIQVTQTIRNEGRNSDGHIVFRLTDANGTMTKPDGGIVTWNSIRTYTWKEGENTPWWLGIIGICDDRYDIEGYLEGVASDGTPFRFEARTPLVKNVCCYWVQGGILDLFVNGNLVATVDYGDGTTCNPNANLTYGGNTYVVVIQ